MNQSVGFIGLGQMGGAIAARLLEIGHRMVVYDPDAKRIAPLLARGARRAAHARDVANEAEIVCACLPSVEASRAVAFGAESIIEGTAICHYVEMSTIGRPAITEIAARFKERGLTVIDAPVSGGPSAARDGCLTIIVSGPEGALDQVLPLLQSMSSRVFLVGSEAGLAQVCKLVNNALSLVGMALACEATVVGVKAGLDARTMLDVINASTGRNSATLDKFPKAILTRTFDYGGPMSLAAKDLRLFLDEAACQAVPTSVTQAGEALWALAGGEGDPQRDFTTLIQTVERWAGVRVEGHESSTSCALAVNPLPRDEYDV